MKLRVSVKAPPYGPSVAARSASKAAPWSPSTGAGRNDVDRISPASSGALQRCPTGNSWLPAPSNPASDRTWRSGRRCRASAQPAGIRPCALSAVLHLSRRAASACCQPAAPSHGWDDQHSARCPPGLSQPRTRPAVRSRSSRWNALPTTASSKYSGSARRVSALETIARTSPRSPGGRLGADQLHHVRFLIYGPHLRKPPAQREGELAGPAGQVQQAAALRYSGPLDQVGEHRFRVRRPVPVVVPGGPPEEIRREPHLVSHGTPPQRQCARPACGRARRGPGHR